MQCMSTTSILWVPGKMLPNAGRSSKALMISVEIQEIGSHTSWRLNLIITLMCIANIIIVMTVTLLD